MSSKPALRNLLLNKTKRDFVLALSVAVVAAAAYKFGVKEQRRHTIDTFYKNYDAEKDYERMKKLGVFQMINEKVEEGKITL